MPNEGLTFLGVVPCQGVYDIAVRMSIRLPSSGRFCARTPYIYVLAPHEHTRFLSGKPCCTFACFQEVSNEYHLLVVCRLCTLSEFLFQL